MARETATVVVLHVEGDDGAGEEELNRITGRLRRELLTLDVDDVQRAPGGPVPEGARAVDVAAIGSLLVSLAGAPAALRAVAGAVGAWVERSQARSVTLEIDGDPIEVTGISSADQRRLIDVWIAKHTPS
jgi:hypothetical protein